MEMIRKQRESDLDDITRIWLTSNLDAHDFIPEEYPRGGVLQSRGIYCDL